MSQLGASFRAHVLQTSIPGCTIEQLDDEHIQLKTEHALGAVNFYDFGEEHQDVEKYGKAHPASDGARFMEIGNQVFMQYRRKEDGSFEELEHKTLTSVLASSVLRLRPWILMTSSRFHF